MHMNVLNEDNRWIGKHDGIRVNWVIYVMAELLRACKFPPLIIWKLQTIINSNFHYYVPSAIVGCPHWLRSRQSSSSLSILFWIYFTICSWEPSSSCLNRLCEFSEFKILVIFVSKFLNYTKEFIHQIFLTVIGALSLEPYNAETGEKRSKTGMH